MNKSKNPKKIIIISTAILLVAAATVAGLEKLHVIDLYKANPAINSGPSKEQEQEQKQSDDNVKQDFIENGQESTPSQPTTPDAIELSAQKESSSVTVLTKLHGISNGTCTLTVTNNAKTNSQTADIIYQNEFSSCAGFSVPISSLGTGTWNILLVTESNSNRLEKTLTFEVK